ncbi:NAD(P)-dependent dehydrogenase (short-subunit alcohol dehydrogenase family) [Pedobacter sp. CG_S7]
MGTHDLKRLKGKVAVITGADSGIGQAIAAELSIQGAHILIHYHSDKKGAIETLKMVEDNGSTGLVFQADVSDYDQVKEFSKQPNLN